MVKHLLTVFLSCLLFFQGFAQKREMRGAWLTTFSNIDWPKRGQHPAVQQSDLVQIFDMYQSIGLNTVFFQVRSQCDAMYQSNFEPWSSDLTGLQGKAPEPFWDPLQFAIDEAHKRGMELHAWINPYRAVANTGALPYLDNNHIAKRNPSWLLASGTLRILNPAKKEVRNHIISIISDILNRYDVDGIHFDDYFYPENGVNDQADFVADPRGFTNKDDWRRDNVNLLVKEVANLIQRSKPWVKFGISPSGIYRNSKDETIGTPTTGLQHYTSLYCDSQKWIKEGWVDYLLPQVYWYYQQPGSPFHTVTKWWNQQAYNRHMYIGLAGYKVDAVYGWNASNEISQQLKLSLRSGLENIRGVSVYNTTSLVQNKKGMRDTLLAYFHRPALQPQMKWKDSIAPAAPRNLSLSQEGDVVMLKWDSTSNNGHPLEVVKYYAIYRSEEFPVTTKAENLLAVIPAQSTYTDFTARTFEKNYYYLITALDRLHNESTPSNEVYTSRKSLPIVTYRIYREADSSYRVKWTDTKPLNARRYVLERSSDNVNFTPYLNLGHMSPVELPRLDLLDQDYWYRIRREGDDVTAYSTSMLVKVQKLVQREEQPIVIVKEEPKPVDTLPEESVITKVETSLEPVDATPPQPIKEEIAKAEPKLEPISQDTVKIPEVAEPTKEPVMVKKEADVIPEEPVEKEVEIVLAEVSSPKDILPQFTGNLAKPIPSLKHSTTLRINVLKVGEMHYTILDENRKEVINGKLWSRSPSAYVSFPGTNELEKGLYYVILKYENEEDGWEMRVE